MAIRLPVATYGEQKRTINVRWSGLLNTDTGEPADIAGFEIESVQMTGTLGTGGAITFQGSNEPVATNYAALTMFGTAGVMNALGVFFPVLANLAGKPSCRHIRPNVTAGDGATSLVLDVMLTRAW